MSVAIGNDSILLSGHAMVEDAEALLTALVDHPGHGVDVSGLTRAHLGVIQLLHASRRRIIGAPADPFLRGRALAGLIEIKDA